MGGQPDRLAPPSSLGIGFLTLNRDMPFSVANGQLGGVEMNNLYDILEVSPKASLETIAAAYRSLISRYHPDKTAALGPEFREIAERRSKEINNAYSILKDVNSRKRYDDQPNQDFFRRSQEDTQDPSRQNNHQNEERKSNPYSGTEEEDDDFKRQTKIQAYARLASLYTKLAKHGSLRESFGLFCVIVIMVGFADKITGGWRFFYFSFMIGFCTIFSANIFLFMYCTRISIKLRSRVKSSSIRAFFDLFATYSIGAFAFIAVVASVVAFAYFVPALLAAIDIFRNSPNWRNEIAMPMVDVIFSFMGIIFSISCILAGFLPASARCCDLAFRFILAQIMGSFSKKQIEKFKSMNHEDPKNVKEFRRAVGVKWLPLTLQSLESLTKS